MRLLILVISCAAVLYLTASMLNRSASTGEANKTLINKPAEVKPNVNKALDTAEKARQDALGETNNTSN